MKKASFSVISIIFYLRMTYILRAKSGSTSSISENGGVN